MEKTNGSVNQTKINQKKPINGFVTAIVITGIILLIAFLLLFTEALTAGKIVIKNDTSTNIDAVRIYFDNSNAEGYALGLSVTPFQTADLIHTPVGANSTIKGDFDEVGLNGMDAGLIVSLMIDGEEIDYNTGFFNVNYKGKITVHIFEENGVTYIKITATAGLFNSTASTSCDTTYKLMD